MRAAAALAILLLAGCAGRGEPDADALRTALAASGNRGAQRAEKLACKASPERPGYVCDYRAPACNRFTGTCGDARPFTGRFLHAGGRWQLVEDLTPRAQPDPVTQPLPGVAPAPPLPVPAPTLAQPVEAQRPAPEPEPAPRLERGELRLVARWRALDARCRDRVDDDAAAQSCAEREAVGHELDARGLCYGPPGAFGYPRAWRRCD